MQESLFSIGVTTGVGFTGNQENVTLGLSLRQGVATSPVRSNGCATEHFGNREDMTVLIQEDRKKIRGVERPASFTFIDLFAGIGGFHIALQKLGGVCVYANEIDDEASAVYLENFGVNPLGDITKVIESQIPNFDLLCGGFPCQPFSKGGYRRGFEDTRGTLFFDISRIIKKKKPAYVLLENVPNLASHDNGQTYETIISTLKELGYSTPSKPLILSPDMFGIPVHRPRVYIPCVRRDIVGKEYVDLEFQKVPLTKNAYAFVEEGDAGGKYAISPYEKRVLDMWNEFYQGIDIKVIGFPVWADEFKGTEDYSHLPMWKQKFLEKNRDLYKRNRSFIDKWARRHEDLSWVKPSHRKFEWQAGTNNKDIYDCLIQFRPSGVRVKRPDRFSALVAMNHAQVVGKYGRRLSPDESKLLQSFPRSFKIHPNRAVALKQLGNAVNVEVVQQVAKKLLAHV